MYQLKPLHDTIAAIATPVGQGGIGIVRISGAGALNAADRIVRLKNGQSPSSQKNFSVRYGWLVEDGQNVDEILLAVMRGPHSYTAEDVVEISCHAGPAVLRAALDLVLKQGIRLAEPGEFTKRAFLNGRLDLTQAEAVLDVICAKTEHFARLSQHQLQGELSKQLEDIRSRLMGIYTAIEAVLNFPEDDIDATGREQMAHDLQQALKCIERLLVSAHNGRILKDGVRVVLCGKPNVGKSSLLNVLLKQDRAIVTSIAGTTRDVLEETAQIQGVPFQLVDTAGILEPRDLIEEEAVKRSHLFIEGADLVLLILDASRPLDAADLLLIEKTKGRNLIFVLNKSDLPAMLKPSQLPPGKQVRVSAVHKSAIEELEQAIIKSVWQGPDFDTNVVMLSNVRHIQALNAAQALLTESLKLIGSKGSWEVVSQGIKDAVNQLDAITGRNIDEDLLDRIFSEFCIGK